MDRTGGLQGAEEGDEEGDGEVDEEAVEEGEDDEVLAAGAGDDGEGGVHGGGAAAGDGGQGAEVLDQQGGAKQGEHLADDVGEQGDGAQFGPTVLGDEDAGQGIVAEA